MGIVGGMFFEIKENEFSWWYMQNRQKHYPFKINFKWKLMCISAHFARSFVRWFKLIEKRKEEKKLKYM